MPILGTVTSQISAVKTAKPTLSFRAFDIGWGYNVSLRATNNDALTAVIGWSYSGNNTGSGNTSANAGAQVTLATFFQDYYSTTTATAIATAAGKMASDADNITINT